MGKFIKNTGSPVSFQIMNTFDDRFAQVKIYLMHLGLNYNGSVFTKESVEQALPSLKNTPILGYIREDAIGQEDYAGHESTIVIEDGGYKYKYLGSAFGVIPETNNARWESKAGDDGKIREYLVVDGLMWTKFEDAVGILERDGIKAQSMELSDKYSGHFDEDGNFVFDTFSFYGACILGDGINPAMQRASIEKTFSTEQLNEEVNRMMETFKTNYGNLENNESTKEGYTVNIEEILKKFGLTSEQLEEKGIVASEFSSEEELEAKITEAFNSEEEQSDEENQDENSDENFQSDKNTPDNPQDSPDGDFEDNEGDSNPESKEDTEGDFQASGDEPENSKVAKEFMLSHDDIRYFLWDNIGEYGVANSLGEDKWDFWLNRVYDEYFIMGNDLTGKLYKVNYTKEGDNISLNGHVEVFVQYLTADEKGALELMRNNYETLESEVESLKEFKKDTEKTMHQEKAEALISSFSLEEEDVKELVKNIHNFSLEDIEKELYAVVGRKNFSVQSHNNSTIKVPVANEGNVQNKKSYSYLFAKHGLE